LFAGTNTNHWDCELLAEPRRQIGGDVFEHQGKATGGLEIAGVAA
jgi:hypothetical protein